MGKGQVRFGRVFVKAFVHEAVFGRLMRYKVEGRMFLREIVLIECQVFAGAFAFGRYEFLVYWEMDMVGERDAFFVSEVSTEVIPG